MVAQRGPRCGRNPCGRRPLRGSGQEGLLAKAQTPEIPFTTPLRKAAAREERLWVQVWDVQPVAVGAAGLGLICPACRPGPGMGQRFNLPNKTASGLPSPRRWSSWSGTRPGRRRKEEPTQTLGSLIGQLSQRPVKGWCYGQGPGCREPDSDNWADSDAARGAKNCEIGTNSRASCITPPHQIWGPE
jgi:hypothetical protein